MTFDARVNRGEPERQGTASDGGNVVSLRRKRSSKAAPRRVAPALPRPRLPFPDDGRYADREEQVGILCAHHGHTLDQAIAEVLQREQNEQVAAIVAEKIGTQHSATTAPVASSAPTLSAFVERWTRGALHETYPDHVKKIDQDDNRERLAYICAAKLDAGPYATVGDVPIADGVFTVEHGLAGMAGVPSRLSKASRSHVARALNRVLNLAVFPCRIITRNPLPKGFVPPAGKPPARAWWRPDDDAKLCATRDIELVYRVFYGCTFREGCRESESGNATWGDIPSASFTLDENKTDDPRSWALYPGTPEALAAWKGIVAAAGLPTGDDDPIFVHIDGPHKGKRIHLAHLAEDFRNHVKKASLWRPEFAEKKRDDGSRARKQLDFHDLRGGFVTWALGTGRTEAWVTDRTGHTSSVMLYRYKRRVRHAEELAVQAPGSLLDAIPELREKSGGAAQPDRGGGSSRGSGSSENERSASSQSPSGGIGRRGGFKSPRPEKPPISPDFEATNDGDIDRALAFALREATRAGEWATVTALANALAARRGQP